MASKKKKKDAAKVLYMAWGEEIPVLCEDSRFFICKEQKFKKNNPSILEVLEVKKEEAEPEEERSDE